MLNMGAQATPPKVDRVPHIPMLEERNTRKGFFDYEAGMTFPFGRARGMYALRIEAGVTVQSN